MIVAAVIGGLITCTSVAEATWRATVTDIDASQQDDGTTVVRVTADESFRSSRYTTYRLPQSPPRAVLRLAGIDSPYREHEIVVGDGNLVRITVGHNPHRDPPELSLVFELRSNDVRISDVGVEGHQLIVQLSGGAARAIAPSTAAELPPTSAPVTTPPTEVPHTAPSPRPTPAATATPDPPSLSSPTPTPTLAFPTPTPAPAFRTGPAGLDGARRRRASGAASAPTRPSAKRPTVLYRAEPPPAESLPPPRVTTSASESSAIVEIVCSQRPDGATLLRITLDQPIGTRIIRYRRDGDDPTRFLLVVHGLELGAAPPSIAAAGPNLRSIDLAPISREAIAVLQLVFHLTSEDVSVQRAAVQGSHLVFVIEPSNAP